MKIKELIIKDEHEISVSAIALVNQPAIEDDFIALSEHKFAIQDKDKRLLIGASLIPNKLIYRNQNEEEFYIYFTKDTIRKTAEKFIEFGMQRSVNIEHEVATRGASVVESWIVEDTDKDKSALYNLSLPVGSWAIAMRVHDDELWKGVKEGLFKGFSIEGQFAERLMQKPSEKTQSKLKHYSIKENETK